MGSRVFAVLVVGLACASLACVGDDTSPGTAEVPGDQGGSGPPTSSYADATLGLDAQWSGDSTTAPVDAGSDATHDAPSHSGDSGDSAPADGAIDATTDAAGDAPADATGDADAGEG